jgi:hypothetical protein
MGQGEAIMTRDELEALWRDPRNQRWGVYHCKADPRLIVPRRLKWMGWTINAAHPKSFLVLLFLLGLLGAPLFVTKARGGSEVATLLTGVASIIVVCVICAILSSRTD